MDEWKCVGDRAASGDGYGVLPEIWVFVFEEKLGK